MKVAEVVIRGGLALEMRAFGWLRDTWLPASGYLPTDLPAFEAWLGIPYAHGAEHFELACQIPIRPNCARRMGSMTTDWDTQL